MRRAHIIIGILLLSFALFYAYLAWDLPDRNLPNTLGPDVMPYVFAVFLALLALILIVQTVGGKEKGKTAPENLPGIEPRQGVGVLLLIGLFALYIGLMSYAGFLLVTPFIVAFLMYLTGSRKKGEIIIASIGVTAFIYVLFHYLFQVPLPEMKFL